MLFAEKLAQEKGIVVPDEAKASSAAMATWINSNQVKKRGKSRRKAVNAQTKAIAPKTKAPRNRSRKLAANVTGKIKQPTATRESSGTDTPLRIPYGNKDVALKLAPAIEPASGMPLRVSILLRSANMGGWRPTGHGPLQRAYSAAAAYERAEGAEECRQRMLS